MGPGFWTHDVATGNKGTLLCWIFSRELPTRDDPWQLMLTADPLHGVWEWEWCRPLPHVSNTYINASPIACAAKDAGPFAFRALGVEAAKRGYLLIG